MAVYDDRDSSHVQYLQTTSLSNYAGALVSLALVAGVSVWGYQLVMRDVSGIPVVRAAEGAMRVAPQNAGGVIADHAGLAVNEVAGQGEAAGPVDQLMLAPQTQALAEEDLRVEPLAEAEEVIPPAAEEPLEQQVPAVVEAVPSDSNDAGTPDIPGMPTTIDDLVGTAQPLSELADASGESPLVVPENPNLAIDVIDPAVPGVAKSLRPIKRPQDLVIQASASAEDSTAELIAAQVAQASGAVSAAVAEAQLVSTAPLASGTQLVQLGAYPTPEQAAEEWTRIKSQFAEFMGDKERVIQEAASGGSTFYRLRAAGFAESDSARRFCEALKAGNAECIPVVVR